ncbi:glycerophosphodiester phosphodiesterase family protein [Chryseobacterium sp. A321]
MKKYIISFLLMAGWCQAQTGIVAHRGHWKASETSQNSISSLKAAQSLNVYGSEFDVQRTLDGVLVINHDADIQGHEISKTLYKDLKNLRLSNGEKLPTLRQYLKVGKKDPKVRLVIEIKPTADSMLEKIVAQEVLAEVNKVGVAGQSEYISFSLGICKALKELDPSVEVQYLKGDLSPKALKEEGIDGFDYPYAVLLANPTWVAKAKALGLSTNSWTVNSLSVFTQLKSMGIDLVTSDIPEQLILSNQ